jgi:hypothetical protein
VDDIKQISVSYIGELAHTPSEDILLVESDEDYVRACQVLKKPLCVADEFR